MDFTAIKCVDLFFKIHWVLDIHFEPNIEPAMNFLSHFIFELEGPKKTNDSAAKKPTTKMYEIHNLIEAARKNVSN